MTGHFISEVSRPMGRLLWSLSTYLESKHASLCELFPLIMIGFVTLTSGIVTNQRDADCSSVMLIKSAGRLLQTTANKNLLFFCTMWVILWVCLCVDSLAVQCPEKTSSPASHRTAQVTSSLFSHQPFICSLLQCISILHKVDGDCGYLTRRGGWVKVKICSPKFCIGQFPFHVFQH